MLTTDTIIISDVHLRSKNCQAKLLFDTLSQYEYETLLIVGDLAENDRAHHNDVKMNWHQFQFVEYLRERLESNKKIVRISGNHDDSGTDFINQILGIKTLQEYEWNMAGKKFCAIHGHQFDKLIFENPHFNKLAVSTYLFFQKIDTKKKYLTRLIDRMHSKWFRLSEAVALGAKEFAYQKNIDVVICGHTHEAMERNFEENGRTIKYFNTGDWTGNGHPCSFITVDRDGTCISVFPE